ncbi:hypothetical protein EZ449_00750 [Pedobacter frigidisoli]|uniref:DUF3592 domain-containing protein n=1 Tax=Pedobacter frigidisoli TaxID=2530455 RepID=A0A4R0P994_9SPHI|nr:hypothetical protein [Pedobacter frigidisoli]TCD12607.1 hypothetical protein EZ449_00750 [Pedobacter frigidisoli]
MAVIRIFGISLVLMGGFLAYGLLGSYRPILFGTKREATIVAVKRFDNKRFTYVYYPVFQFAHQNKTIRIIDKSGDVKEDSVGLKAFIYYDENYGISRGFTSVIIIFSIISISCLFFGLVALLYKGRI